MYATTWAALRRPDINASYVDEARYQARREVELLGMCLSHLEQKHAEYAAIKRDIAEIEALPGYRA